MKVIGSLTQEALVPITVINPVWIVPLTFIGAEYELILPPPLITSPIEALLFVQLYVVPIILLVKAAGAIS